ncbi:tyrosinase cofactor [Streptomyces canus]|uniref:tyrosinase family oxidase copper chaperone n=1 Tax=Streptomyces canus TaxID=58343 RepID=UPI0022566555|nr:tyrosinase family oxidase copper chaperone [Streptomyces canus]MCX4860144.1 tyrosinase cofactor [Streptomyces canus]WSW34657.1 tyrosinase cofactor [Streptomyces canus]
MVMSVGRTPVGADPSRASPERGAPARRSRRDLLLGLFGPAAVAVALTPVVLASRGPRAAERAADLVFDETYRGRRIRGIRGSVAAAGGALGAAGWHVTVDGRPLHLMRRADGTWLSMVDHYRSYATALDAARAAVDELGPGRQLQETWNDGGDMGGHGGVHA